MYKRQEHDCAHHHLCEHVAEDVLDDEDLCDPLLIQALSDNEPPALSAITHEDLVREQATDPLCISLRARAAETNSTPYYESASGLLVRISPRDKREQVVVPETLRSRILQISHHSKLAGHPGAIRMYNTLRRSYYWPSMSLDVYNTVRNCVHCAKQRVTLRKHANFLKLFPANHPNEYVAIDILGPLPRTRAGYQYILVITDRFSKLTQTCPLRVISAYQVAKAFCATWVFT